MNSIRGKLPDFSKLGRRFKPGAIKSTPGTRGGGMIGPAAKLLQNRNLEASAVVSETDAHFQRPT